MIFSKDTFPAGAFHFVAVTYDGIAFRLYVNGVLEAARRSSRTIQSSSVPLGSGKSSINGGPGDGQLTSSPASRFCAHCTIRPSRF